MDTNTIRLGTTTKRLDQAAVQQGVEVECPFRPDFFVTVLPGATWNPRFRVALQNQKARGWVPDGAEGAELTAAERFLRVYDDPEFIAEALVAGWRGVVGADGAEVEFDQALCVAVLSDPGNLDVREWIVNQATTYGRFYTESVEEEAGNSGRGSSGKKAGAGRSKKTES